MRGKRRFLAAAIAGAMLLVAPTEAAANGGSYLEFDRTHYVPGTGASRWRTSPFRRGTRISSDAAPSTSSRSRRG